MAKHRTLRRSNSVPGTRPASSPPEWTAAAHTDPSALSQSQAEEARQKSVSWPTDGPSVTNIPHHTTTFESGRPNSSRRARNLKAAASAHRRSAAAAPPPTSSRMPSDRKNLLASVRKIGLGSPSARRLVEYIRIALNMRSATTSEIRSYLARNASIIRHLWTGTLPHPERCLVGEAGALRYEVKSDSNLDEPNFSLLRDIVQIDWQEERLDLVVGLMGAPLPESKTKFQEEFRKTRRGMLSPLLRRRIHAEDEVARAMEEQQRRSVQEKRKARPGSLLRFGETLEPENDGHIAVEEEAERKTEAERGERRISRPRLFDKIPKIWRSRR